MALVKLAEDLRFNDFVKPACINTKPDLTEERLVCTGWGSSEWFSDTSTALMKLTTNRISLGMCASAFPKNHQLPEGLLESQHLCTGLGKQENYFKGIESGAPLQIYDNRMCMAVVVGVKSLDREFSNVESQALYSRVSNYVGWIAENAFGDS